jgi:hypothetical protein
MSLSPPFDLINSRHSIQLCLPCGTLLCGSWLSQPPNLQDWGPFSIYTAVVQKLPKPQQKLKQQKAISASILLDMQAPHAQQLHFSSPWISRSCTGASTPFYGATIIASAGTVHTTLKILLASLLVPSLRTGSTGFPKIG